MSCLQIPCFSQLTFMETFNFRLKCIKMTPLSQRHMHRLHNSHCTNWYSLRALDLCPASPENERSAPFRDVESLCSGALDLGGCFWVSRGLPSLCVMVRLIAALLLVSVLFFLFAMYLSLHLFCHPYLVFAIAKLIVALAISNLGFYLARLLEYRTCLRHTSPLANI